jgi:hypothetical protein
MTFIVPLSASMLEELHRAFALLGLVARLERSQIPSSAGFRIPFARVEPIFSRREFANHIRHLHVDAVGVGTVGDSGFGSGRGGPAGPG